jgi:hypothetical protein
VSGGTNEIIGGTSGLDQISLSGGVNTVYGGTGSDLIDGRDRAILAYDYGSLTFVWKGNSWRVV